MSKVCDMDCFSCRHADCINDDFRKIHRSEYDKAWREQHKNAGLCARCGTRPLQSAWFCQECLQKIHKRTNSLHAERIASGLCPRCGRPSEDPRYKICVRCRLKAAEYNRWGYKRRKQKGA